MEVQQNQILNLLRHSGNSESGMMWIEVHRISSSDEVRTITESKDHTVFSLRCLANWCWVQALLERNTVTIW